MLRSKKDEIGGKTSAANVQPEGGGDNPTTDPKPIPLGEWTKEDITGRRTDYVAEAHNAALAAAIKQAHDTALGLHDEQEKRHKQQLAAEYKRGYNDCDCELNGKRTTGEYHYTPTDPEDCPPINPTTTGGPSTQVTYCDNPTTGHWEGNQWCPHTDNPTTGEPDCPVCGSKDVFHTHLQPTTGRRTAVAGEWTLHQWKDKESYDVKCGDKVICGDLLKFEANMIINAHNAALAAEREIKSAEKQILLDEITKNTELLNQLAAEREKVDNATDNCMSLSQLLYAEKAKVQTLRDALLEVNALARGNMTGCGTCNHVIAATIKAIPADPPVQLPMINDDPVITLK